MINKYTFLLPAYKAKYLALAIKSILCQTYSEFKLIIVDDASPENLKQIIDTFADERILYLRNEVNLGGQNLCDNWHHCLQYVDTEYMILASDDDVYEPEFLEYVDRNCKRYPQVSIIRANTRIINGNGDIEKEDMLFKAHKASLYEYLHHYFPSQVRCIANTVYRTDWIKKHGFSVYDLAWHSDNMTAFQAAKNNGIVLVGDKILFNFRVSGINISSTVNSEYMKRKSKASSLYFSDLVRLIGGLNVSYRERLRMKFQYMRAARLLFYGYLSCCYQGKDKYAVIMDILKCDLFRPIQHLVLFTILLKLLFQK